MTNFFSESVEQTFSTIVAASFKYWYSIIRLFVHSVTQAMGIFSGNNSGKIKRYVL